MERYLIYLRKSRKDRDLELSTGSVDTLERHRRTLLALAEQRHLPIAGIFEEVVSGDTIAERPEMQKLLAAVETGSYAGVLVMEVPRLARGNTRDQGTVAETFQYTNTKIITPDKIYDPSDESDEEYFEFGLFLSRREYKAINRRLQRGRLASLQEGKYIGGTAPYGYEKIKLTGQRGYSLRIVPEEAEVVRRIFALYASDSPRLGGGSIARLLNTEGISAPGGGSWSPGSVRDILRNPVYAGFVRWSHRPAERKMVSGRVVESHPVSSDALLVKGLHEPIVSPGQFDAAQASMEARRRTPVPGGRQLSNPLAGLVYCSVCGRALVRLPHGSKAGPMLLCPTPGCPTVGSRADLVETALLESLRQWLSDYRMDPNTLLRPDRSMAEATKKNLSRLRSVRDGIQSQRGRLCELLEQGVYTKELFWERSCALAGRLAETEQAIRDAEILLRRQDTFCGREIGMPFLRSPLDGYEKLPTPAQKNALMKEVLDHAVYTKSTGGRYGASNLRLILFPRLPRRTDHL